MTGVPKGGVSQQKRGQCPVKGSISISIPRQGLREQTKGLGTIAAISVTHIPPPWAPNSRQR